MLKCPLKDYIAFIPKMQLKLQTPTRPKQPLRQAIWRYIVGIPPLFPT